MSMLSEQIPALRDESNQKVISGPINIARGLSERFPMLFPTSQTESIHDLVAKLNGLDWFSLSLPVPETIAGGVTDPSEVDIKIFHEDIEKRLGEGASAWYRAALMYRIRTYVPDWVKTQQ